jgi:ankyrin repeat protein
MKLMYNYPRKNMTLPPEIFTIVHPYLSICDISSLALTNSDVNRWIDMDDVIREYRLVREDEKTSLVKTACQHGYINLLMYLHRTKNVIPKMAMEWANGHLSIAKYLYTIGVDPTYDHNRAIILASSNGHLDVIKYLCTVGANPFVAQNYPLMSASENGHLHVVQYLCSIGADPRAFFDSAIRWASVNGHLPVVKYLYSLGADPTSNNDYAIIGASRYGHLSMVEYLCSVDADPTVNDNEPIRLANRYGHYLVVKFLREQGASLDFFDG